MVIGSSAVAWPTPAGPGATYRKLIPLGNSTASPESSEEPCLARVVTWNAAVTGRRFVTHVVKAALEMCVEEQASVCCD